MLSIRAISWTISYWVTLYSLDPIQYNVIASSSLSSSKPSLKYPSSSLSPSTSLNGKKPGAIGIKKNWGIIDVRIKELEQTTLYSTIGFVNLSKRTGSSAQVAISNDLTGITENEMEVTTPHVSEATNQKFKTICSNFELLVTRWIKNQLSRGSVAVGTIDDPCDFNAIGKICAMVINQDGEDGVYCREGDIMQCCVTDHDDGQNFDDNPEIDIVGDVMEGIGCVADTIIIFDDGSNHSNNLHERMLRLITGIKRRRGSFELGEKFNGKIHVVAFVISEDKGEPLSHTFTNMRKELDSLQERFEIDNGKDVNFEFIVEVIPLPNEVVLSTTPAYRNWNILPQNNTIPLSHFDQFIRSIITRISDLNDDINISFRSHLLGGTEQTENGNFQQEDVSISSDLDFSSDDLDYHHPSEVLSRKLIKLCDEILLSAEESILSLESKQDEILLDSDMRMPLLEFGSEAERILQEVSQHFDRKDISDLSHGQLDVDLIEGARRKTLGRIAGDSGILRLFHTQLQSLREYYGRQYETIIDQLDDETIFPHNTDDGLDEGKLRARENKHMMEAAKRSTEGFRTAAENAIPLMCSEGILKGLVDYTYISELDGLIRDMMHATSSRKITDDTMSFQDEKSDDDAGPVSEKAQNPPKWYYKLVARSFVYGVNYLQGWLALQGIRKAAMDRDKQMPKFPLF